MSNPDTPPLANEILDVIVSSFQPSRGEARFHLDVDIAALQDKPRVVSRLFRENPWEKAALAKIYEQQVIRASMTELTSTWAKIWRRASQESGVPPTIFIESGSTCAYVSELLRRFVAEQRDNLWPFSLGTNNHLTAWLFLNRHDYLASSLDGNSSALVPYLYAGRLESKYHGIFPFYPAKDNKHAEEELNGYAQLRLSLARSHLLLLAASRLSLKYGPLVGSRENAIFKNACYNACVSPIDRSPKKEIHLFITVQKLVAHTQSNQEKAQTSFIGFHSWKEEHDKIKQQICFPVFDIPYEKADTSHYARGSDHVLIRSPFSTDLIPDSPQRLRDGTFAVEIGEGRFRICHTWQELFTKAGLTVKIFTAFKGTTSEADPNYQWINAEVDDARQFFKPRGISIDLKEVGTWQPEGSSEKFSLVKIEISHADSKQ